MDIKANWQAPIRNWNNSSNIKYYQNYQDIDMKINFQPLELKVKRLSDTAILPTYGSEKAAGMDLYADVKSLGAEKLYIGSGDCLKIPTGFSFELPEGYCALILARSGLSIKKGLRPANCVGLCDEDYRGNYIVPLYNDSHEDQVIEHGDRIAQLMFVPYVQAKLTEVTELSDTDRGLGGFGSTGDK